MKNKSKTYIEITMKHTKAIKAFLLFFVVISIVSCKNDENSSKTITAIVGEWQRSDFNDEFEYKLIFDTNNTGYSTQREGASGGPQISTARSFNWNTNNNVLKFNYDGEIVTTSFAINAEGQLLLPDLTDLYFIKLD